MNNKENNNTNHYVNKVVEDKLLLRYLTTDVISEMHWKYPGAEAYARKEGVSLNKTSNVADLVSICSPNLTTFIKAKGIAPYIYINIHFNS